METVRLLSDHFRLSVNPATGKLAGVFYAALTNPQARTEKIWALKTVDFKSMGEEELLGRVASMSIMRAMSAEIRGVDAFQIEDSPFLEILRSSFRLRGYCDGSCPKTSSVLLFNDLTVVVGVPLLTKYSKTFQDYVMDRKGVAPELIRDRILSFLELVSCDKGSVVEIPFWNTFTASEQKETAAYLKPYEGRIYRPGK